MCVRSSVPNWTCVICGRLETGNRPTECVCGAEDSFRKTSGGKVGGDRGGPVRASELSGSRTARISTGNAAADKMLGGGLPRGKSVLLRGPEGSGKSRVGLQWAAAGGGLVVCLEMDLAQTREVAASAGADPARLWLVQELEGAERAAEQCSARVLLVDSITVAGRGMVRRAAELRRWAGRRGVALILISHENKRGGQFGPSGLGYGGDVTIRCVGRGKGEAALSVLKSRYGPRAKCVVCLVGPNV